MAAGEALEGESSEEEEGEAALAEGKAWRSGEPWGRAGSQDPAPPSPTMGRRRRRRAARAYGGGQGGAPGQRGGYAHMLDAPPSAVPLARTARAQDGEGSSEEDLEEEEDQESSSDEEGGKADVSSDDSSDSDSDDVDAGPPMR